MVEQTPEEIASNRIDYVYESKINELDLRGLGLTAFPRDILKITYLRKLHLDSNNIRTVPKGIRELTYLDSLSLAGNKLTTIPGTIAKLVCCPGNLLI